MNKTYRMNRPGDGVRTTTPMAAAMIVTLGGGSVSHGTSLTHDEFRAIQNMYGYENELCPLAHAGMERDAVRDAREDGLRLVAWIARFVEPGEDPLRTLIRFAIEAGMDVDPEDAEYAEYATSDGTEADALAHGDNS